MATNDNSAGAVFIELGLDLNQLESDFIAANATIQQNLNRLNRERNIVDLRAQVEIGGLDESINQTQILETRQRSLTQQLSMQRDRIRLTEAAHRQLVNTQGAASAAAQNMESRLQREQLALQRLQQQLERVTTAQSELSAVNATAAQDTLIEAGRSVQQNLSRLGRERDLIELRAQVEIGGLDETTNQSKILETRQRSLNEQLNIQRTRIRLVEEAHRRLASAQGSDSAAVQDMETRLQRERLTLQRLEQQLDRVRTAQENLNNTSSTNGGGASGNTDGGLDIGGGGLEDLADSVLERIPPQARIAAGAIAGLGAAIIAAGKASTDLIERWRELQTQAYDLNMSVQDTEDFLRKLRLAGGEFEDFKGFIRGLSDAMIKGEIDDPEAMVFARYGESAFDASGKIKNFQAMTETIERMYDKAKSAGEEIEFLQMLGGESGVTDAIQYLERYKEAKEDAAKISTAKLDPTEFHEAERSLNRYNEQQQEFINALENLITPARVSSLESLFEVFHDGTEYLVENKDEIQSWGFIAAETFTTIADKIKALKDAFVELADTGLNFNDWEQNGRWNRLSDLVKSDSEDTLWARSTSVFFGDIKGELFGGILERAAEEQDKYKEAVENATEAQSKQSKSTEEGKTTLADLRKEQEQDTASWADFRREQEQGVQTTKEITAATEEATAAKQKEINVLQQYSIQREKDLRDELAEVQIENQNFKHGYDLELAKLDWERTKARRQNVLSTGESLAIEDLYAEKRLLLEKQTQDKLDDLRNEATEEFKTDLEKRNIEIENSMDDWIDAGMKESEAETLAQALKAKAIEDLEEEWNARVLEINGSALEKKLANIEREKQAWIDKGISEVEAEQLAQQQKAQVYQQEYESAVQAEQAAAQNVESAEQALNDALEQREELRERIAEQQAKEITQAEQGLQVLRSQLEAFRAYRDGGEKGLQEYYLKELRKQGITDKDLKMTPAQLEGFQQANRDVQKGLMPNLAQVAPPNPEMLKQLSKLDDRIAGLQKNLADAQAALKEATKKRQEAEDAYNNQKAQIPDTVVEENPDGTKSVWTGDDAKKRLEELGILEKPTSTPETASFDEDLKQKLDSAGNSVEDFKKKLDEATPTETPELPKTEMPATAADIPTPTPDFDFSDIAAKFEILPPIIENISSGLDNLTPKITDVSTAFSNLYYTFQNTNIGQAEGGIPSAPVDFSELTQQAAEILSAIQTGASDLQTAITNQQQSAPPNVTNNISIHEAHAWDYEHINDLAERVADIIEPKILSAVGGDSNGY